MKTTVTFLRTSTFTEYELTLPCYDLHDFFITFDWYDEFLNHDFITIQMKGGFDFLCYDETVDIEVLNKLFILFNELPKDVQETILYITHSYGDTVEALHYALLNYDKYTLVPDSCKTWEEIATFVLKKFFNPNLLKYFESAISLKDFYYSSLKHGLAWQVDNRILIKSVELLMTQGGI